MSSQPTASPPETSLSSPSEILSPSRPAGPRNELESRLQSIKRASAIERLAIAEGLAEHAAEDAPRLIKALRNSDWHIRWGAAHALGRSMVADAAPGLRPLLQDPQPRVARTAAWALGRLHDRAAVADLAAAVQADNARLSASAAWALGHIGTPEAVEALVASLEAASPRALRSIAIALSEIGPEASELLVQLLQSGTAATRTRAASILARFGPSTVPLLIPLLQSQDVKHRRAAAHILGTLDLRSPLSAESTISTAGAALITALTDDDSRVRRSAARSLGSLKYIPAGEALEKLLQGEGEDIRVAANALAALEEPAAGPALTAALDQPGLAPEAEAAIHRAMQKLGLESREARTPAIPFSREQLPTRYHYLVQVTPGLEMVAWEEIATKLAGSTLITFDKGTVIFRWTGSPQAGAILRSARQLLQGGRTPQEIPLARRLRRYRVRTLPASLDATTAYCLAHLANLGERDVFVDLTCGSATIAIERALDGPARLILAGDMNEEALAAARENVLAGSQPVHLLQWDAGQLPLPDRSVSAVAANLPYGRRSGSHQENATLYPAIVKEAERVLRSSGMAVLLTTEKRLMRQVLEDYPTLHVASEREIAAGGLTPTLFVLQKD